MPAMLYMFFKSLHIFVAIAWVMGLMVCGVLLRTRDRDATHEQQRIFNSRMASIALGISHWWVMPCMAATLLAALYMTVVAGWWQMHWVFAKLAGAALLVFFAVLQARAARHWRQAPMVLPSAQLGLLIPLTLIAGFVLLYLAFSKPF